MELERIGEVKPEDHRPPVTICRLDCNIPDGLQYLVIYHVPQSNPTVTPTVTVRGYYNERSLKNDLSDARHPYMVFQVRQMKAQREVILTLE